jgi:hypothetical protein
MAALEDSLVILVAVDHHGPELVLFVISQVTIVLVVTRLSPSAAGSHQGLLAVDGILVSDAQVLVTQKLGFLLGRRAQVGGTWEERFCSHGKLLQLHPAMDQP